MIAFACANCGMKFQVKAEFAGRSTRCPTCKQPLVVPLEATVAWSPPSSRLDAPDHVEARLLRAQLLISRQEYVTAAEELRECLQRQPGHADSKRLVDLCARAKKDDGATLLGFAEELDKSRAGPLADCLLADLKTMHQERSKLLEVYRKRIEAAWKDLGPRLSLRKDGSFALQLENCRAVSDLSPLKGMPLAWLNLGGCDQVRDLSPLKDMPLTYLNIGRCAQARDLSPLKGMPLVKLGLQDCSDVRDLSPLENMPLAIIRLPPQVDRGTDVLRRIKTLETISGMKAVEFWKKYDAGEFPQYKP